MNVELWCSGEILSASVKENAVRSDGITGCATFGHGVVSWCGYWAQTRGQLNLGLGDVQVTMTSVSASYGPSYGRRMVR